MYGILLIIHIPHPYYKHMKNCIDDTGSELPIQRCIAGEEVKNLADHELVAVILGTGSRDKNVLSVAMDLINGFEGLRGVYGAGIREMAGLPGIGLKKAIKILAAFELGKRLLSVQNTAVIVDSPDKVWRLLQPEMGCLNREEFKVIVLNNKNHVLKKSTISMGTVSEAIIHPREIFRDAIREAGTSIIVAHNHPSGVLVPSSEDISATRRIKEAGAIIGIELLDHVIIGISSYLSLKEAGFL